MAQKTIEDEQDRVVHLLPYEWKLDGFPGSRSIRLPLRNAIDPVTINYVDSAGDPQTFTDFTFAGDRVYPEIITNNVVFPETQFGFAETVTIGFTAGYLSSSVVPDTMKQAILAILDSLFKNCHDENFGPAYQALAGRQLATYL